MKKDFVLAIKDHRIQFDVEDMMDTITPVVQEFYDSYNIKLKGFVVNSTIDVSSKIIIHFKVANTGYFPIFTIEARSAGTIIETFKTTPLTGVFRMGGVDKDYPSMLNDEHGVPMTIYTQNEFANENSIPEKVKDLFSKAKTSLDVWKGYAEASEIFLF